LARTTRIARALLAALLALPGCAGEPAAPRSVICIVVDTLRADRLGAYGYTKNPTSPQLDAWLQRARLYELAFAPSPWTLPSMGSIYSGRWPAHHGAGLWARSGRSRKIMPLEPDQVTLAERFQEAGFETAAIVSNHFLGPRFGTQQGFGLYDFQVASNERGPRADELVRRALDWLDARPGQRVLLLVQLFDPHMNYDAPPPFHGRFTASIDADPALPVTDGRELRRKIAELSDDDRRLIGAAYDEEVAFVDAQLGLLLEGLEQRGLLREGLVVLTADHGEELFEHGSFEHGHSVWQELLHVPLAFWGGAVRPGRDPVPVSLVDLAPTLLDAVGLPPLPAADGVSLWPNLTRGAPLPKRPLYAEGVLFGTEQKAVIDWPEKLVWVPRHDTWERFDLSEDPAELHGGAPGESAEEQERKRAGLALWSRRPADEHGGDAPVDAATREALEKLGYLE
jgi:arylsulfatase A-like enzyme